MCLTLSLLLLRTCRLPLLLRTHVSGLTPLFGLGLLQRASLRLAKAFGILRCLHDSMDVPALPSLELHLLILLAKGR